MKTLEAKFDAVAVEQLIKRIYSYVNIIKSANPKDKQVSANFNEVNFSIKTLKPTGGNVEIQWYNQDEEVLPNRNKLSYKTKFDKNK